LNNIWFLFLGYSAELAQLGREFESRGTINQEKVLLRKEKKARAPKNKEPAVPQVPQVVRNAPNRIGDPNNILNIVSQRSSVSK
jgi:hypothetical protein